MRFFKALIYFYLFSLVIISCKKNPSSSDDDSTLQYDIAPLAFEDDFSQNILNWNIIGGNWHISDGALYVDGPKDSEVMHIAYKVTENSFTQPFKYIVDVDFVSQYINTDFGTLGYSQRCYGIGISNNQKAIVYMVNPHFHEYYLAVFGFTSLQWQYPIRNKRHSDINQSHPASLMIIYQNDSLELYYNEDILAKIKWANESFNEFDLIHQSRDTLKFDNVRFHANNVGTISKENFSSIQKTVSKSKFYVPSLQVDYRLTPNK